MMSDERFKSKYYLKSRQGVVLGVVKVNEEENVLHWNEVVSLLNSLSEKNERLRKENDDFHKSIKEYEDLRKRLNKDKSRLIEEKMSLNAFIIEKGLLEEYMRWENE